MYGNNKHPSADYNHPTLGYITEAAKCLHSTPNTWMKYKEARSIADEANGFLYPGYAHGGLGRNPYVAFLDIDYDKYCAICKDYDCYYDGHKLQHMIRQDDYKEAAPKIRKFLLDMEERMGGKMPWQRSLSGKGTHWLFTINDYEADKYKYIGGKLVAQITDHAKIETWNPTGSGRGRLVASEDVFRSDTIPTIRFDDYKELFPPVLNKKQQEYKRKYNGNNSWKSPYYSVGTEEVINLLERRGYDVEREYNSHLSYRIHASDFQCHDSTGGSRKMGNPSVQIGNKYTGEFQIVCHSECGNSFMRLHEIIGLQIHNIKRCRKCFKFTAYHDICYKCKRGN